MKRHPPRAKFRLALQCLLACALGWSGFCGTNEDPETGGAGLRFSRLGLADGLSHADVRCVVRDHQGFMWFATWLDGLNRYDGYTFKVYRHDSKDAGSLAFDNVAVLYEDRLKSLWVGTYGGGLDRYDREADAFEHFRHRPGDTNSLPEDTVRALCEDGHNGLWVGTGAGLSRFDRTNGTFRTYRLDSGGSAVRALCWDRISGLVWAGETTGVIVFDPVTERYERFMHDPADPASLSHNHVVHIYQDRRGDIWVCTNRGLNRWNRETRNFTRYRSEPGNASSLGNDFVSAILEDRAGRFWVGTADGVDLLNRVSGTFVHYRNDPSDSTSFSGTFVNTGSLYEDDTGAIWIGTQGGGVNRVDGRPAKFLTYRNVPNSTNSLSQNTVTALCGDRDGNLWIGTADGLDRFDGRNFVHFRHDPKAANTLAAGPVWALAEDPDGSLWVGVNGGGVCRFDGTRFARHKHDPANPASLGGNYLYGLQPDGKGGLWISVHSGGLDHFDGREFTHIRPDARNPDSLPELYVGSLVVAGNDSVWMGSATMGLIQWNPAASKSTVHLLDPQRPRSKVGNWVRDINWDGTNIWVASYSGLFCFDLATREFTRCYTEKDGLASGSILSVQPDASGNVWVSTTAGLSKLDRQRHTFRNYDVADGLQSGHFCERSRARLPDGRIAFGGVNGFNLFDPDRLPENPVAPPVVLTDFQLFNKPVPVGGDSPLRRAIHVADQITLRYDQEVLRLGFAALDFAAPRKNRYAYRLEGFDREWRHTTAEDRSATYTKLDPGSYVFRVKASNNDGVWNETGASVAITILPPWWRTWWFRSVAVAAVLALAYALYSIRIASIQRRNRKLEHEVAARTADLNEKTRALQTANRELEAFSYSVSHDLRAPLRSIDGFSSALLEDYAEKLDAEGRENLLTIRSATQRMGHLIDDMLRLSRINRGEMTSTQVDLSVMAEEIARDLRRSEPHRSVEFVVAPGCMTRGDASLLRIAMQNMFSNAWKYTGKKADAKIEFGCVDQEQDRVFYVRDNGCGFDMNHAGKLFNAFQRLHDATEFPGTGIGLASVQRVIQRHGGRVWIEGEQDRGAVIYFTLPS